MTNRYSQFGHPGWPTQLLLWPGWDHQPLRPAGCRQRVFAAVKPFAFNGSRSKPFRFNEGQTSKPKICSNLNLLSELQSKQGGMNDLPRGQFGNSNVMNDLQPELRAGEGTPFAEKSLAFPTAERPAPMFAQAANLPQASVKTVILGLSSAMGQTGLPKGELEGEFP